MHRAAKGVMESPNLIREVHVGGGREGEKEASACCLVGHGGRPRSCRGVEERGPSEKGFQAGGLAVPEK